MQKQVPKAVNPELRINPTYRLSRKYIVLGSPTPGGFAGYLRLGTKNRTKNIIPAKTNAFFLLFEPGNNFEFLL